MSSAAVPSTLFDQFEYGGAGGGRLGPDSSPPRLTSAYLCLKAFLTAANAIFLIFSVVIIAVASYALSSSINALTGVTLPAGLICLGVFILLLSFLGALSVWKESRVGLALYLAALLCIILALFAVSVAVYVRRGDAESYIRQGWQLAPPDVLSALEVQFACCGLDRPPLNATASCPSPSLVSIPAGQTCLSLFVSAFQSNLTRAGGCGIAFAVVMGLFMTFVVLLLNAITRKRAEELERLRREGALGVEEGGGNHLGTAGMELEGLASSGGNSEDDDDEDDEDDEDDGDHGEADEADDEEELSASRPTPTSRSTAGTAPPDADVRRASKAEVV